MVSLMVGVGWFDGIYRVGMMCVFFILLTVNQHESNSQAFCLLKKRFFMNLLYIMLVYLKFDMLFGV